VQWFDDPSAFSMDALCRLVGLLLGGASERYTTSAVRATCFNAINTTSSGRHRCCKTLTSV